MVAPQDMTTCVVGGAPATCLSAFLQPTDPPSVFSGRAVHVFPAPLAVADPARATPPRYVSPPR